jgi:hypothetical protein
LAGPLASKEALSVSAQLASNTIVEPGYFRTELLVEGASSIWPELSIDDYAERTTRNITVWKSLNGQQGGDPAKLGAALVSIAALETPGRSGRDRPRSIFRPAAVNTPSTSSAATAAPSTAKSPGAPVGRKRRRTGHRSPSPLAMWS